MKTDGRNLQTGTEPKEKYYALKVHFSKMMCDKGKNRRAIKPVIKSIFSGLAISSDNYLKFLVEELKPFIDKTYSTFTDPSNTFVAGSSMGGLISLYALCEYPNVFGGAACLSTHWPGLLSMENNPVPSVFFSYLKKYLPSPKQHKIYFDHGTETLDSMYASLQLEVDAIMKQKKYSNNQWISLSWPGQDHSEKSWRSRLNVPLTFLLKK